CPRRTGDRAGAPPAAASGGPRAGCRRRRWRRRGAVGGPAWSTRRTGAVGSHPHCAPRHRRAGRKPRRGPARRIVSGMGLTKVDRDEVQGALFEQWAVLEQLLRTLDDAEWRTPTVLPGWTVQDVAAHIIGTESMLDGRETPDPPGAAAAADHVRNPVGELNERWVESMRGDAPADVMDRWTALLAR